MALSTEQLRSILESMLLVTTEPLSFARIVEVIQGEDLETPPEAVQAAIEDLLSRYRDAGRTDEALPLLEEAYRSSAEAPGLEWVANQLFDAYKSAGKKAEAIKQLSDVIANARKTLPASSPPLAGLLARFALELETRGVPRG